MPAFTLLAIHILWLRTHNVEVVLAFVNRSNNHQLRSNESEARATSNIDDEIASVNWGRIDLSRPRLLFNNEPRPSVTSLQYEEHDLHWPSHLVHYGCGATRQSNHITVLLGSWSMTGGPTAPTLETGEHGRLWRCHQGRASLARSCHVHAASLPITSSILLSGTSELTTRRRASYSMVFCDPPFSGPVISRVGGR